MKTISIEICDIIKQLKINGERYVFRGDEKVQIVGFSDPYDYKLGTIIWAGKPEDIHYGSGQLKEDDISLIIVNPSFDNPERFKNYILTDDPRNLFMRLVAAFYPENIQPKIESTAIISEKAEIGKNCYIGHNVIISDDVAIGDNTIILSGVYIGENVKIGSRCRIGQNTIIGGETIGSVIKEKDGTYGRMPNIGGVVIEDDVNIGSSCQIERATFTDSVIGTMCRISSMTTVGHNCRIGKKTMLIGKCALTGNIIIEANCQIFSATIKNRVVIGENSIIGLGSVVLNDIEKGSTCFGNPARNVPKKIK